jgi:hypothetical protein
MDKEKSLYSFFENFFKIKFESIYNVDCNDEGFRNDLDENKLITYVFEKMLGKEEFKLTIFVPYEEEVDFIYTYLKAQSSDGYCIKFYGIDNAYASIVYLDDNGELIKICNDMTKAIGYYISMDDGDIREVREYMLYVLDNYIEKNDLKKEYDIKIYSEDLDSKSYRKSYAYVYHFQKKGG